MANRRLLIRLLMLLLICVLVIVCTQGGSWYDYVTYKDPSAHLVKYLQKRTSKVNPGLFDFLIQGESICGDDSERRPFLVITIMTAHQNKAARNRIRQTWGGQAVRKTWPHRAIDVDVRLAFLLGRSQSDQENTELALESEEFHDIVQGDFLDTYMNLTRKTLSALRWSSLYCPSRFLLKADDDTFIHIPNLISFLQSHPPKENGTVYGKVTTLGDLRVQREGKWKLSYTEYPFEWHPAYIYGPSYVVSGNLVPKLVKVSEFVQFVPLEDIYVTGWLVSSVQAEKLHVETFQHYKVESERMPCVFWNEYKIAEHHVTGEISDAIWDGLQQSYPPCRSSSTVLATISIFVLLVVIGILWKRRTLSH